MNAFKMKSCLVCLFSIAALLVLAPRGAFGQSMSNSGTMDPDGVVEMTVELAANSSEIDGYVGVENDDYNEYGYDCWYYLGDYAEWDAPSIMLAPRRICTTTTLSWLTAWSILRTTPRHTYPHRQIPEIRTCSTGMREPIFSPMATEETAAAGRIMEKST